MTLVCTLCSYSFSYGHQRAELTHTFPVGDRRAPSKEFWALCGDQPQETETSIPHHVYKRPFRAPERSGLLPRHSLSPEQDSPVTKVRQSDQISQGFVVLCPLCPRECSSFLLCWKSPFLGGKALRGKAHVHVNTVLCSACSPCLSARTVLMPILQV